MLKRKILDYLFEWKRSINKKPLIISGARQIGKTTSIKEFGKTYDSFIEINFVTMQMYKKVFAENLVVDEIVKQITLLNNEFHFIPGNTLLFLDEIQEFPDAVSSLKSFSIDGRYDVICSGSLLGVQYKKIRSIPVGFKENIEMKSLDFEEFLWACGIQKEQIEELFSYMRDLKPLPEVYLERFNYLFNEYLFVGGMPEVVNSFVTSNTYNDVFKIQKRIFKDYEDDVTKYCEGLDTAKILNFYRNIFPQLAKENHKFQISKIKNNMKSRDFLGVDEWLKDAGIINQIHNLSTLNLPLRLYSQTDYYRIYFKDHSLYIADLDEEGKKDFILNKNFEIYNGSFYENVICESLINSGWELYFYKNQEATIELDFVVRVKNEIIPIEVKKNRGRSKSLNSILSDSKNPIKYGVKFSNSNIGFKNNIFTFPHFLSFLLKRFFEENNSINFK